MPITLPARYGGMADRSIVHAPTASMHSNGHAIAAHWTFSDGGSAEGMHVTHPASGGLTATVTVVDGAGDEATKTVAL
ncbi:MAG TPA: PKD domain-containing protein [Solirubrobacteraceae bacterium]